VLVDHLGYGPSHGPILPSREQILGTRLAPC
jgi:hypothetical protein